MAMKNTVEVVIAGKVFKISGFESAEYLHQVSVYINEKLAEFQKMEGYRRQTSDQKQLMLNRNADDKRKSIIWSWIMNNPGLAGHETGQRNS